MNVNPYTRLKEVARSYIDKVTNRPIREAFIYTMVNGDDVIKLAELYYAAVNAERMGYEMEMYAKGKQLRFRYVGKLPTCVPYEIRR